MTTNTLEIEPTLVRHLSASPPPGLISLYLFGSHAEGRSHRESDIDIAVVLDRTTHPSAKDRFEFRVKLTGELIAVLEHNEVDVVVLNDAPPLFARAVLYRGRSICCPHPDQDRDFRRDVQLRAADLEPWLERHRQMKIEALSP